MNRVRSIDAWTPLRNIHVGEEAAKETQRPQGDHKVLGSVWPESPVSPQFSYLRHGRGETGHHGLVEPVDGEAAPPTRRGPRAGQGCGRRPRGGPDRAGGGALPGHSAERRRREDAAAAPGAGGGRAVVSGPG